MKDKEVAEDKMSNTEKRLEEDIENQKTNYHDASFMPKRTLPNRRVESYLACAMATVLWLPNKVNSIQKFTIY